MHSQPPRNTHGIAPSKRT
ncbi:unnamed protein product [Debaryomyces tyrocola]|nr:unnamed protein product [Debaryomyces tyrocola]